MTDPRKELVEKMVKRVLKEWTRYDRANVQMDSETEARLLSGFLLQEVLDAIEDGYVIGKRCSECGKDYRLLPAFRKDAK